MINLLFSKRTNIKKTTYLDFHKKLIYRTNYTYRYLRKVIDSNVFALYMYVDLANTN